MTVEMTFEDFVEPFIIATVVNVTMAVHLPQTKSMECLSCNTMRANICHHTGSHQLHFRGTNYR